MNETIDPEGKLIREIKKGSMTALFELYACVFDDMIRQAEAYILNGDHEASKDVVLVTFVSYWMRCENFETAEVKKHLIHATYRTCLDYLKSDKPEKQANGYEMIKKELPADINNRSAILEPLALLQKEIDSDHGLMKAVIISSFLQRKEDPVVAQWLGQPLSVIQDKKENIIYLFRLLRHYPSAGKI